MGSVTLISIREERGDFRKERGRATERQRHNLWWKWRGGVKNSYSKKDAGTRTQEKRWDRGFEGACGCPAEP